MKKKEIQNIYEIIKSIRDFLMEFGVTAFGLLGFIYGSFALMYFFASNGIEIKVFEITLQAFGYWISITLFFIIIATGLKIVLKNKKNFRK